MARKTKSLLTLKSLVAEINNQYSSETQLFGKTGYGASFPPWQWRVPVTPNVSGLYWDCRGCLCGEVVKSVLDSVAIGCINYCSVELVQSGTLKLPLKRKIPFTDDIERLMCASDDFDDPSTIGSFSLMSPTVDTTASFMSKFVIGECDACGRDILDNDRLKVAFTECDAMAGRCELALEWAPEVPLFVSHVYGGGFIVTPEVFNSMKAADINNYVEKVITVA